jgi:hypothetical protein
MKKVLLVALVLLLAVPAVSFAGSATSRFDVTIGGMVKVDVGYASQGQGADMVFGARSSTSSTQNVLDEYGNFFMAAGETRLNFLVKGPDAWGAKTSAFIEGDFRGAAGASAAYGLFQLRHAFLKFDWPESSLLIGQTWQSWGLLPCFCLLGFNELGPFLKGVREPQITYTQNFGKDWSVALGIFSPVPTENQVGGSNLVDDYTRIGYPHLTTEILWKSDACGKIGPWMMQFGVGGFIGQEKATYVSGTNTRALQTQTAPYPPTGTAQYAADFNDDKVLSWAASFKWYIPIIPEKKPGAMGGSLGFAGVVYTGQNMPRYLGPFGYGSYDQDTTVTGDQFVAPVVTGGWGQLFYYLSDQWSVNFQYGYGHYTFSRQYQAANVNNIETVKHYVGNVIYDVNAAIRLGVEGSYLYTRYSAPTSGVKTDGAMWGARFAAYYFF